MDHGADWQQEPFGDLSAEVFTENNGGCASILATTTEKDISTFQKISPPIDRFWADAHVIL